MRSLKLLLLAAPVILGITIFLLMCGSGGGGTGPDYIEINLNGAIEFPGEDEVSIDDLTIGFGDNQCEVDSNSEFNIDGNRNVAGLMFALDESDSTPVFMAVVPDPSDNMDVEMNAYSTALALVFMNPFVCTSEPEEAKAVIDTIENLPEFYVLVNLLETKMEDDCKCWTKDDDDINTAVLDVIAAFLQTFPTDLPDKAAVSGGYAKAAKPLMDGVMVSPTTETAGHKVSHEGGKKFKVTNAYGRWAWCVLPSDEGMWLKPNGQMFDFFKDGLPWAPSEKEFEYEVEAGADPVYVDIYGLGWRGDDDNLWMGLTTEEKMLCLEAGLSTIALEFGGHLISLYGNLKSGLSAAGRWEGITDEEIWDLLDFLKSEVGFMDEVRVLARDGKWGELTFTVSKKVLTKFVKDENYRNFWFKLIGKKLSEQSVKKIEKVVVTRAGGAIAFGAMIGENVTSLMKTWVGATSSRFKTTFKIWKVVGDFGNVEGGVFDKDDGEPIEGAVINLLGDDDNPINPPHTYSTESDGGYLFQNILVGDKQLQVTKTGYKAKTVNIDIQKQKTIQVDIELEKIHGFVSGRILNDIYVQNEMDDSLFDKDCNLRAEEIDGENRSVSYSITDGTFNIKLFPGQWWIVPEHEDYKDDSIQATVVEDEQTTLNDFILQPDISSETTIELDMNADGIFEITYSFQTSAVAASQKVDSDNLCGHGNYPDLILVVGLYSDTDNVFMLFNTDELDENSAIESWGSIYNGNCQREGLAGSAQYLTTRYECTDSDGDSDPIFFGWPGGPYYGDECRCGVDDLGGVTFERYGEEIADVIQGYSIASLPGWKSCYCEGIDNDEDGDIDEWEVTCARVRVTFDFKVFVGTEYITPESVMKRNPFEPGFIDELIGEYGCGE